MATNRYANRYSANTGFNTQPLAQPLAPQRYQSMYQPATSVLDIAARYGNRNALTDTYANASRFGTNPATPFSFPAPPSRDSFYRNGNTGPQPVPMPIRYFRGNAPEDQTVGGFSEGSSGTFAPGMMTAQSVVDDAKAEFMARGGSNRQWNKANVAAGIRPKIDARSGGGSGARIGFSTTSGDIRKSWGWNRETSMDLPY